MAIFVPHAPPGQAPGRGELRSTAATVGELLDEVGSRVGAAEWKKACRASVLVTAGT
jgi:hypothetical protein